jgi:Tfp pilus assembly protein PilX
VEQLMRPSSRLPRRARQAGLSLLFALMSLVILGLGAVALLRSVDTGTLIIGNMSFKQDAAAASAAAAEQAITWLSNNSSGATLNADSPANGYYASARDMLDVTGNKTTANDKRPLINWDGNCNGIDSSRYDICEVTPASGTDVNGNSVRWVITRLCDSVGVPSGSNRCLRPVATAAAGEANERGELKPGGRIVGAVASPFYRILVRVQGPRNTVVYTETLLHF